MKIIKVQWTRDSEIGFINPDTMKREWYGSDMAAGSTMEFADVVSGNPKEIRLLCGDGEIGTVDPETIRFI